MSNNNIEISKFTLKDFNNIKDIIISDFDDFWNTNTFIEELKDKNSYYIIAKIKNEIVGFAGVKIIFDEADIMNIVTRKNMRKLGIGFYLLKNLINISKEKGVKKFTLEVNEKNIAAIHLYEKLGFKKIAVRNQYYNNIDNAIIMQLTF